ncbi:DUF7344 domain-containing protein [Halorussus lipolyticus]|uniref:DUF7344 domain-containing protein n=1 Tax=Halorussus lipolyticus TaxID=3034024 RepID=UPI0023E8852A|nr:hypothetical protein [Halorussus sp. DT80]
MTETHLSATTMFDLLKDRRRRYLLYALDQDPDPVVTLDELTRKVLDWEGRMNAGVGEVTAELETQIRVSLHHNHLPKMASIGLLEYDAQSKTVRKRSSPSVVAFMESHQDEVPHLRSLFCTSATS